MNHQDRMTYSVRDLAIVTAYSALILSQSDVLNAVVITASCAACLLLVFLFGLTTLGAVFHPKRKSRTLVASLPLLAILIAWVMVLVLAMNVFSTAMATIDSIALSMLLSIAAASVPFLFNMQVRQQEPSDRTIWIGYWTLCVATTIGALRLLLCKRLANVRNT